MKKENPVYLKTIEEVEKYFSTDMDKGLSSRNANKRLREYGVNNLEKKK